MIKTYENLTQDIYQDIRALEALCLAEDKTSLKLELEYKLAGNGDTHGQKNEFLYYRDDELVGYIGISDFGGNELEIMGMVHPDDRRQGIFSMLHEVVMQECRTREPVKVLLLCDAESKSGHGFTQAIGGQYESSEYEMHLRNPETTEADLVRLVKATNRDAKEVSRQEQIYFNDKEKPSSEKSLKLPEEEEKRGITIYLGKADDIVVGKVNLVVESKMGFIYGLGVLPEYRRRGYGRQILLASINKLVENGCVDIMLQVAAENENALSLYLDVGFQITSIMDYHLMKLVKKEKWKSQSNLGTSAY